MPAQGPNSLNTDPEKDVSESCPRGITPLLACCWLNLHSANHSLQFDCDKDPAETPGFSTGIH